MATGTNKLAAVDGDMENGMIQAGQSLLPITAIEPMQVIMDRLVEEAKQTLQGASAILG